MSSSTHEGSAADGGSSWVETTSCTLPTAEQPVRVAEFDDLFGTAVRAVERIDATTLRLVLDASARDRARDLAARETTCCSFFSFDLTPAGDGRVAMRVGVPAAHVAVLDGFAARAASAAGLTPSTA
jgi:hypothetical protein